MTNQRGILGPSVIGCTLLLLWGCSSSQSSGGSPEGTGQSRTSGTGKGGSGPTNSSANGGQLGGASASDSQVGKGGNSSTSGPDSSSNLGGASSQSSSQSTKTTSSSAEGGKPSAGGQKGTLIGLGGKASTGGQTAAATNSGEPGGAAVGGQVSRSNGGGGGIVAVGTTAVVSGGKAGGPAGKAGSSGSIEQAGKSGVGGGLVSGCVGGKAWPTANPAAAGPFEVETEKGVGPLAGYVPDPIYENEQQRFNIYRPKNLATSGYCHPILVWANGHTDNPEPNPPKCVVDSGANKWCGQYLPLMKHLASHGFFVIASLSTTTSKGDPLPTIAGLNWLLEQAEDSTSSYYHRLDTANIGQLGHSEGGMSTCMVASEPRYKALATICGTRTLSGVHTPMMFFCGSKDTTVKCSGVRDVFLTVKDQPAVLIEDLNSDHGGWVYNGANGVSLSAAAAWFRVHLMGDTANRKYFYGTGCSFCTDNRVKFEQNSLMTQ